MNTLLSHFKSVIDPAKHLTTKIEAEAPKVATKTREGRRHVRHTTEVDVASVSSAVPSAPVKKFSDEVIGTKEWTLDIKRPLGNGAFGVVYLAEMPNGEQVAVKKVLQDKRYKNREHEIISELHHHNIVELKLTFFTTDSKDDSVYLNLVLEYVPETLHKVIKNHRTKHSPMPELDIKIYLYQLCRSFAYLHSLGICHRDIKPQNLLVDTKRSVIKLCDFGSAKRLNKTEENVSYICSRFYRAPELIFGATQYTTSIDMWSLGCVCAEMIKGGPMFTGENTIDQLIEIIKVLGAPTIQEVRAMNHKSTDFKFPSVQRAPLEHIFPSSSKLMLDFLSKLLVYTPSHRLDPLRALSHPVFDELRDPFTLTSVGQPLPALFNFSPVEIAINPKYYASLIPEHAQNSENWPCEDVLKAAIKDGTFNPAVTRLYKVHHPYELVAEEIKEDDESKIVDST